MKAGKIINIYLRFDRPVLPFDLIFKWAYLSSTPRPAVGKSSNGWQRTSSTGISPSHGSHATAPIACDGFTSSKLASYHSLRRERQSSFVPQLLLFPQSLTTLQDPFTLITLGLWLDGSIIVPIACHRLIESCPMLIADCFSLPAER